jgi:hypothetical protein
LHGHGGCPWRGCIDVRLVPEHVVVLETLAVSYTSQANFTIIINIEKQFLLGPMLLVVASITVLTPEFGLFEYLVT